MNMRIAGIIAFVAVMAAGQAPAQTAGQDSHYVTSSGQLIHCVASASGRTYCGTSHTRYTIQGSPDPRCIEGQTWGLDDQGVWVADGCVADFSPASGDYVNSSGELVHCVSTASGRAYCGSPKRRYAIAGTPDPRCVEGQTWGLDDQGVWVADGCVADFTPVTSDYVNSNGQLVHCVSTASGRTYCGTANTRYTIYGNPDPRCVEGQTWGLDDRGVWVANGCVADFSPVSGEYVTSGGKLVHCVATGSDRVYCGDGRTRYVIAGSVDARCVEGQTWGFDERGVWVANGCVADFSPVTSDYVNSNGQLVHCVSTASGRTYCGTANTRYTIYGNPDPRCIEGQTWGLDERGVWVANGCVADFTPSPVYSNVSGKLIRCDATGGGRTYCRNVGNRRYMLRQTREGNCIEGKTWGIDANGLWVSGDCHGDFDDDDDD